MAAAGTTAKPEGARDGERSVKRNREETSAKLRPIVPDLDLDTVEQEPRHKSQKHQKRSGKNKEEEEGRAGRSLPRNRALSWGEAGVEKTQEEASRRSRTVSRTRAPSWDEAGVEKTQEEASRRSRTVSRTRAPSWDEAGVEKTQEEASRRSRTVSRTRAPSWDRNRTEEVLRTNKEEKSSRSLSRSRATSVGTSVTEETAVPEVSAKKLRSKRKEADLSRDKVAADRGSKRISEPFSFLMARDDQPSSDSESVASFSEVSQSAASIAWREESDWRSAEPNSPPGRWLKPSSKKLTQVLIDSRLSGQSLVGGLSL